MADRILCSILLSKHPHRVGGTVLQQFTTQSLTNYIHLKREPWDLVNEKYAPHFTNRKWEKKQTWKVETNFLYWLRVTAMIAFYVTIASILNWSVGTSTIVPRKICTIVTSIMAPCSLLFGFKIPASYIWSLTTVLLVSTELALVPTTRHYFLKFIGNFN